MQNERNLSAWSCWKSRSIRSSSSCECWISCLSVHEPRSITRYTYSSSWKAQYSGRMKFDVDDSFAIAATSFCRWSGCATVRWNDGSLPFDVVNSLWITLTARLKRGSALSLLSASTTPCRPRPMISPSTTACSVARYSFSCSFDASKPRAAPSAVVTERSAQFENSSRRRRRVELLSDGADGGRIAA